MSNNSKLRGYMYPFEFEIDQDTKDLLDDLLTRYPSVRKIIKEALTKLHEENFGSLRDSTKPKKKEYHYHTTLDPDDREKIDTLLQAISDIKENQKIITKKELLDKGEMSKVQTLSKEDNKKILKKIEELGVKFTKIISSESTPNGQKTITAEMSQEEVLQLIKRIDQLEAKLTRAISNSQRSISSSRRSSDFDDSDAPKIGKAKPVEGEIIKQDRPLLDDVLDSVIVSVEKDEKSEK